MARAATIKAIKALPYMTATFTDFDEYRVTIIGLAPGHAERVAYYTSDEADAIDTARAMSERHAPRIARDYDNAKAARDILEAHERACGAAISAIPGIGTGAMGLTPDAVKQTVQYRTAKEAHALAFAALRSFNGNFTKLFAYEIKAERDAKRAAMVEAA